MKAELAAQGLKGATFSELFSPVSGCRWHAIPTSIPTILTAADGRSPMARSFPCTRTGRAKITIRCTTRPRTSRLEQARRGRGVCLSPLQLVEQHCSDQVGRPGEPDDPAGRRGFVPDPPRRPLLLPQRHRGAGRAPGEWYLDRASDTLYIWPPAPLVDDNEVRRAGCRHPDRDRAGDVTTLPSAGSPWKPARERPSSCVGHPTARSPPAPFAASATIITAP